MIQARDFQSVADPVRLAAESVEGRIESALYDAWKGLSVGWGHPFGLSAKLNDAAVGVQRAYRRGLTATWDTIGPMDLDLIRKDDASEIEFHFDRVAPTTVMTAQQMAAQWVREISDDTRSQINQITQAGLARGQPAPVIARTIKESIGLTEAQAKAVANYRRLLETGRPAALDYRLRDPEGDEEVEEAITRLRPLKQSRVDELVAAYYERYLHYRARMIARFESLFASNTGASSAIEQAIARGALPAHTTKSWLVANDERLCPRCRSIPEIQPAGVTTDKMFEWRVSKSSSGLIMVPPLHPSCRCTLTYRVMR